MVAADRAQHGAKQRHHEQTPYDEHSHCRRLFSLPPSTSV
jgi:hypothetical protein